MATYAGIKSKVAEANEILAKLDLNEKVALCSGQDLWHLKPIPIADIPPIMLTDGPHGVIKRVALDLLEGRVPATCFPTASALASSWNAQLVEQVGAAIGREAYQNQVGVVLGPGMNIKRSPLCGRNFEYFSADPYLTGVMGAAFCKGVQSQGVGACIKHVCVNNQEFDRFRVNVIVDERTLREIYLRGFEMAIKEAQPWTLMTAYNKLNGTLCSEHNVLWSQILRKEWGFEGVIMTDWGATDNRIKGIASGVDLEMPGSFGSNDSYVVNAIQENAGSLSEDQLNEVVRRVICLSLMGKDALDKKAREPTSQVDAEAHAELAKRAAMDCAVLLKNDDKILPLKKGTSVAVIGDFAKNPRYQGMGSSQVKPTKLETAWDQLSEHTNEYSFAPGYHQDEMGEEVDEELLQEAAETAKSSDVAIIFTGLPGICESEGFDRENMDMPPQHCALIQAVCGANPNTIVVLANGPPLTIESWVKSPKAVIEGYLGGQESGAAMVDLIFGVSSPSGKLAETFPVRLEDVASHKWFPGENQQVQYREGLNVDYRYFDTAKVPVLFPFGHGLSYSSFDYNKMKVSKKSKGDEVRVEVKIDIKNTGGFAASEVVQCYVHSSSSEVYRPDQELKAFDKVFLNPGERKTVVFSLNNESFQFYDVGAAGWVVESGSYEIRVGSSSRDIRTRHSLDLSGKRPSLQARMSHPPQDNLIFPAEVSDEQFALMLDGSLPAPEQNVSHFHRNTIIGELSRSLFGSVLAFFIKRGALKHMESDKNNKASRKMAESMLNDMPLRSLVLCSQGALTYHTLDIILALLNHQYLKLVGLLFKKNQKMD